MTPLHDLPVLSEIFLFLDGVGVRDVCHLSLTCRTMRDFFTNDRSLQGFWFRLLHRAAHKKHHRVDFMSMRACYPTRINPASFYFIRGLEDIRVVMGECKNPAHIKYIIDDRTDDFSCRNLYIEWQSVMWRRKRSSYWSSVDEKRLEKMRLGVNHLENRKQRFQALENFYADRDTEEMRRIRKVKRQDHVRVHENKDSAVTFLKTYREEI